jgi:hypothetical protein
LFSCWQQQQGEAGGGASAAANETIHEEPVGCGRTANEFPNSALTTSISLPPLALISVKADDAVEVLLLLLPRAPAIMVASKAGCLARKLPSVPTETRPSFSCKQDAMSSFQCRCLRSASSTAAVVLFPSIIAIIIIGRTMVIFWAARMFYVQVMGYLGADV